MFFRKCIIDIPSLFFIWKSRCICLHSDFFRNVLLNGRYGLVGIVVRRQAHDPRAVASIPALATFEESILGQGVNTNRACLHSGV